MIDARNKGARLELERVKFQKSIGYSEACTTRNCSRVLDSLGVDLVGIPIAEQCKNGYDSGLSYQTILKNMETKLKKSEYKSALKVIIHKKKKKYAAIIPTDRWDLSSLVLTYPDFEFLEIYPKLGYIIMDIKLFNKLITHLYGLH